MSALSERDDGLRAACFGALDRLGAHFGGEIPYRGGLERGFTYDGARVPFFNQQKGIFRAARQHGPAALAIQTSAKSPYEADEASDENGYWYAYRDGVAGERDNGALRSAWELQVPLVYYRSTLPGSYVALYPFFVELDDPYGRRVHLTPGLMYAGNPVQIDGVERAYAMREVSVRLHQGRFRRLVIPAYANQCAICRLRQQRLLDAAHIRADALPDGHATVANGLSLCTIHHRAYDQDLVGIDPDYRVHVAPRLLDEEDGPMLELLKGFHGVKIAVPRRAEHRPSRELLDDRFAAFARA